MPELPEVEHAVIELRPWLVGRRIARLDLIHPALKRAMSPANRRSVVGARIAAITRRGKHQLIGLDDGRTLLAHFRMTGEWAVGDSAENARYPRAALHFDDGSKVVLDDPRALSSIVIIAAGVDPVPGLGPDANDPTLTGAWFFGRLAKRSVAIKLLLLDQSLIAGIGNIYAAESLWHARIDPTRAGNELRRAEVTRLLTSIRAVLHRASGTRYSDGGGRFSVYDRLGEPCRRCQTPIVRITQGGRSTYYCPKCQR